MKGYKGFDKDLKCQGFQYEVGKTYKAQGKIALCENGFHFCKEAKNIKVYYGNVCSNRYCEIKASGKIIKGENIYVCSRIKIVREIPFPELITLINKGSGNTGWNNCGNYNAGDNNTGNYNLGSINRGNYNIGSGNKGNDSTGYYNSGNNNTGMSNNGNENCGNINKGHNNIGHGNKGHNNIGYFNRGSHLCGIFNTADSGCIIFNKYTNISVSKIIKTKGYHYLSDCIFYRAKPADDELKEIKKLPNFDEKIMNELIFGKEETKNEK